jgi:Fructosamine-3-kinase
MAGRRNIYYWKSDRAFASENTRTTAGSPLVDVGFQLRNYLNRFFRQGLIHIEPFHGQGNHITFVARYADSDYFIRLENGPEADNYMAVESAVMKMVREQGIPCPIIYHTDVSRRMVPFAIQVMELVSSRDLNHHNGTNKLDVKHIAFEIGAYIAKWQAVKPPNFGLFDVDTVLNAGTLLGYHKRYSDYFHLNLENHLDFLVSANFLSTAKKKHILALIDDHEPLLHLNQGCLVHKDLAFWNILSDGKHIHAFIDWDDAVSGDPVDDLSLLACFHPGDVVASAISGYEHVSPSPDHFEKRFWLHLLRNMIFKAVIRVRGNYFDMPGDFFMNNGQTNNLKRFTLARIESACEGLRDKKDILSL